MSCLLQIRIFSRCRIPSYHRLSDFTRCLSSAGSSFYLLLFTGSNIYFKARDAAHMEAYFPPFFTSRSWVPLSAILPRSSTRIRSALWIMGIFSSFSGSTKAVASSGTTMGHFSELPLPGKCAAAPRRRAVFRRPLPWYGPPSQAAQEIHRTGLFRPPPSLLRPWRPASPLPPLWNFSRSQTGYFQKKPNNPFQQTFSAC